MKGHIQKKRANPKTSQEKAGGGESWVKGLPEASGKRKKKNYTRGKFKKRCHMKGALVAKKDILGDAKKKIP